MSKKKQIKTMDFGFENCESVLIPGQYIGSFRISTIPGQHIGSYPIGTILLGKYPLDGEYYIKEMFLEILSELSKSGITSNFDEEALSRIHRFDDITSLSIEYEDGSTNSYRVSWDDADYCDGSEDSCEDVEEWYDQYSNKYQTSYLSEEGNLYLLIGKDLKLENFVTKEIFQEPSIQQQLSPWYVVYYWKENTINRYIRTFEKQMQLYKMSSPVLWDAKKIRVTADLLGIMYLTAVVLKRTALLQKVQSFYEDLMELSNMLPPTQKKETIEILKKSHEDIAENLTAMIKKLDAGQQIKK